MQDHLRLANATEAEQRNELVAIVLNCPVLMQAFQAARDYDLPDWWIVSGAIYNQVWNHLTGRPDMNGVNDIDLMYFDPDTDYDAEDRIIKQASGFPAQPPVEIRNQARVHLWYEKHFGVAYAPLSHTREAIDRFACLTHCVGMKLGKDGEFEIYAPFGLSDIFSFRIVPNTARNNRETHERKGARQLLEWPELTVLPWVE